MGPWCGFFSGMAISNSHKYYCSSIKDEETHDKNYLVIVLVIIVAVYNSFPRAPAVKLKGYIYINICVCVHVLCRIFFGRSNSFVQSFADISIASSHPVG